MTSPAILALVGPSGGGKTTWLSCVVRRLAVDRRSIATVKTCHHDADLEPERKDSARHLASGAAQTLLLSPGKRAILRTRPAISEDEEILSFAETSGAGLVLVEGGRSTAFPKVAVRATDVAWDLPTPFPVLAAVGAPPVFAGHDWTDPEDGARGILRWMALRERAEGVLGTLLAGGAGRRLGGVVKARLSIGGTTLARRAESLLATVLSEIAITGPDPSPLRPLEMKFLRDAPAVPGPLGGLLAALRAARKGVFLLGVDQVGAVPATIERILEAGLDPDGPAAAVLAEGGGMVPTIAFLGVRHRAACEALAREGVRSIGAVLERIEAVRIPAGAGEAQDIDEPVDLERMEVRRGS